MRYYVSIKGIKKPPLLRMKGVYQAKKKYQALTLVRSGMINQISILV